MLPFHSGSFKIAEKSGCAIIPISMNNTAEIFENHLPFVRKTHVIIEYGKPIYMKDMDKAQKKNISEYCQNIIRETTEKNRALV